MKEFTPLVKQWGIFEGPEAEGCTEVGEHTLFIRFGDPANVLHYISQYQRVYFCIEYRNWDIINYAAESGKEVCIEVTPDDMETTTHNGKLPYNLEDKARLYLKLPYKLKAGDTICTGESFYEESLEVGQGTKSHPNMYQFDRELPCVF